MKAADELAKHVGVKPACAALEVSRSTLYRRRGPSTGQQQPRPTPARALSETERGEVFDTLCSERFVDRSPAEVVATLLDEEVYLCSERTMYRVLASEVPVQERRAQRTHPEYKKPELMATAPNQVWSWDITRLLGPKKWSYYYLYVIMDIYSRYVVGWMVADRENSALAGRLIQQSCLKHGVQPRVLTLHSDRGTPMTSQCTAHRRHALLPTHQPALRARIHRAHVQQRVRRVGSDLGRRSHGRCTHRSLATPLSYRQHTWQQLPHAQAHRPFQDPTLASCGAEPFTPQEKESKSKGEVDELEWSEPHEVDTEGAMD